MSSRAVLTRPAPGPDHVVRYGDHPDHLADVFAPTAAASGTLVLLVHGGFWRHTIDRTHTRATCAGLAAAGHGVAAIEYRRAGQPGGGWPGTLDDVAHAVDTVPTMAATCLGQGAVRRTVVVGHSAGGHLAAWAAGRPSLPTGSPWHRPDAGFDAAVSLAGVVDLSMAHERDLGDGAVAAFLGAAPDRSPARSHAADPARLRPAVPVVLVHGRHDRIVPVALSRAYARAHPGADVRLEVTPGGHFAVIDPLAGAWDAVLRAVAGEATRPGPASEGTASG